MLEYSMLLVLLGLTGPPLIHVALPIFDCSARSTKPMMLRVFSVAPPVFVTHTSMRLMVMPLVMLGSVAHALSYVSWK